MAERVMTSRSRASGVQHRETDASPRTSYKNLLRNNYRGVIDNPVARRTFEDVKKDVHNFYLEYNLEHVVDEKQLLRGALMVRDEREFKVASDDVEASSAISEKGPNHDHIEISPHDKGNREKNYLESLYRLSKIEKEALVREQKPKLIEQTKELNTVIFTCCVGAIVQGWSQASITGANLQWPYAFGLQEDYNDTASVTNQWVVGGVNGITYFAAASIGAWISDPLNDLRWGRRGALFAAGVFTFAASIASAFVDDWPSLFGCRLLLGIGYGAKASVVPIFESEVSPKTTRGRLLVSWQTFTALGILLGSAVNLVFHGPQSAPPRGESVLSNPMTSDNWRQSVAWRLQIASCAIPAVVLLCLVPLCSESPRWLVKKGRYDKAYKVLRGLRETPLQATRDLYEIYAQLRVETVLFSKNKDIETQLENWTDSRMYPQAAEKSSYWSRVMQLFTVSRNRRASLAACTVMASQQLSGINIFAFLNTTLFSIGGNRPMISLWLGFGFAAANAVGSPIAYFFIDSKGRRFLLLFSLLLMLPLLLAMAFSFRIPDPTTRLAVTETFVILYTIVYSPGAGVVPFLYSSEVFPLINREAGMSLACSVSFTLAGVLALTVPQLVEALGPTRLLCLFAGLDAAAAILVWLFAPGTVEASTLEEMSYLFGVPTAHHVQYQTGTVLPWVVRRCVPGKEAGPLEPLYHYWRSRSREMEREGMETGEEGHGGSETGSNVG
ncbi:MFS general substrate transporter [Aulographum hederae CBS 113979]|uniref:MFS general substrate transporter n=1 Tax=Aulographum hederae CBS 113979 TaxID=1176131 RepID=A0A6G1H383_9PEZI|nr:MFS general substrate transporter [Aulographum hederae CBS 113979]